MKKYIGCLVVVIISIMIVTGCTSQDENFGGTVEENPPELGEKNTEIQRLEAEIVELKEAFLTKKQRVEKLENEVESLKLDLKYMEEEKDHYKAFIDGYLKGLDEKELLDIAKSEVKYDLFIKYGTVENQSNEKIEIPSDGEVPLDQDTFVLTISERQPAFPILLEDYSSIYNQGFIDQYTNALQILDYEDYNWEGYAGSGTIVDAQSYEFIHVPKGQVIHLEVTDPLKERLGLNTNRITITIP